MTDDIDTMVREVIEEAERLISQRTAVVWFIGRNMCGYMPECDVVACDTWEAAKAETITELIFTANEIDDEDYAAAHLHAAAELDGEDGPEWSDIIGNGSCDYSWWINVETMDADEAQRLFDGEES